MKIRQGILIVHIGVFSFVIGGAQSYDEASPYAKLKVAKSDSAKYRAYSEILQPYQLSLDDSVFYYLNNRLALAEANDKRIEIAHNLGLLAFVCMNKGQYGASLDYYLRAFEILENPENEHYYWVLPDGTTPRSNRLKKLTNFYFNFGHLMRATQNRALQQQYYEKVIVTALENNDPENISYAHDGIALYYLEIGKPDSAVLHTRKSLAISAGISRKLNEGYSKYIHGLILYELGQFDSARQYFHQGLISALEYGNVPPEKANLFVLSKAHRALQNKDSSLYYGYRAVEGYKIIGDFDALSLNLGVAYENMYQIYNRLGINDSAFIYLQKAKVMQDSLLKDKMKNLAAFQQLQLSEQMKLKELEKQQALSKSRFRANSFLAGIFLVALLGLFIYRSYRIKKRANYQLTKTLDELKATQALLIQSEKMAALGELTAGIAHEIQNPLNFVNNFSEVSKELVEEVKIERIKARVERDEGLEEELLDDIAQNLEKINHHGKRADAIVKSMLQHSRTSSGQKEPTDFNALCEEYLRLAYHGMKAKDPQDAAHKSFNATFMSDLDTELPKVTVIPQDMGRVLLNLIGNAFYAVHQRSKANEEGYKPEVLVETRRSAKGIEISVSDNGTGIPDALMEKIFQPFFTTKPTGEGTGLGLSLSYDIIKAHGGEMEVESMEGEGTTFIIKLPIA